MSPTSYQLLHPAMKMVEGEGFEPSKSKTADLQSAPFGRSGIPPKKWSWREDLNLQPADYKSAALPIELRQHIYIHIIYVFM